MNSDIDRKEALKKLRHERRDSIKRAAAASREQKKAIKAIIDHLGQGPETVPGLAEAVGLGPDVTLWYIASLKKYGQVVEDKKDGGFFRYALAPSAEGA